MTPNGYNTETTDTDFKIENGVLKKYMGKDTDVNVPPGVTVISTSAFTKCNSIINLTIPDSVQKIESFAFSKCKNLRSITIGNGVSEFGNSSFLFFRCESLNSITVNDGNPHFCSIDGNLYTKDGATLLKCATGRADKTLVIPDRVTEIADGALSSCNITHLSIGAGITSLDAFKLNRNKKLANITVSRDNPFFTSINGNLYTKDGATLIRYAPGKNDFWFNIPKEVTNVSDYAFSFSKELTDVVIPEGVSVIGDHAFTNCNNLQTVIIPKSVKKIDREAFYLCYNLTLYLQAGADMSEFHPKWHGGRPIYDLDTKKPLKRSEVFKKFRNCKVMCDIRFYLLLFFLCGIPLLILLFILISFISLFF